MGAFRFTPNKFKAKRTALGFASQLEQAVYFKLIERERLGLIRAVKRQVVEVLKDCPTCGDKVQWKVDFSFEEPGPDGAWRKAFAEAKGVEDKEYRKKLKLWREHRPHPLEIWKGNYKNPKMVERIECK